MIISVLEKTTSEAANLKDMTILTTYTEETGEIYHVNLTSIANVINFEGKTPRSVVDDLLNMNKRKSTRPRETYLLQDPKRKETANPKQLREQRSMSDGFQDRLPQREFRGSSQTHNSMNFFSFFTFFSFLNFLYFKFLYLNL